MATRIGGGETFMPPAGTDTRMDRQREEFLRQLREAQLSHNNREGEQVLDHVVRVLRKNRELDAAEGLRERKNDAGQGPDRQRLSERVDRAERAPERGAERNAERRLDDAPRLIAEFQREHGLPPTGRLDPNTVNALQEKGALPPAAQPAQPGTVHVEQAGELADPGRTPLRPEDKEATRRLQSMQEQAARTRVEGGPRKDGAPRTEPRNVERALDKQALDRQRDRALDRPVERSPIPERAATDAHAADRNRDTNRVDAVPDPSHLLASLLTPGLAGKRSQTDEAMKASAPQDAPPAPPKGESADPKKTKATNEDNHEALRDSKVDRVVDQKPTVRRALTDSTTSRTAADRDVKRDPVRPQAPPDKQAPTADVAARAPLSSSANADDRMRLDTVLASQQAVERGVQEATGDPHATKGAGEKAGEGQGVRGQGGAQGGGTPEAAGVDAAAPNVEGPPGHETVQGNAKAGDDDFLDDERGNANVRGQGEEGVGEGEGFWRVPPLSEQVRAALDTITRDADTTSAATYSWDVTFYRPGVYGPGQPAPEIWRLVVARATAFDTVWREACDAITIKYLYLEPDTEPPTMDDFVWALRRARVREASDSPPSSSG
ncbi:MAG: peptidoglycan-binding protein [Deltaproteobacteria bacterium]|nr:peptidoglycan-binding protein [Deltaproteobacteria bacterium]